jgi:hypothetical protein
MMFRRNCFEKDVEPEIKIPKHSSIERAAHQAPQFESRKGLKMGESKL